MLWDGVGDDGRFEGGEAELGLNGSFGLAPVTAEDTPAAEAIGLPGWTAEATKVPPGRTITAQTIKTIGSSQIAFGPGGVVDISQGDEAWRYRNLPKSPELTVGGNATERGLGPTGIQPLPTQSGGATEGRSAPEAQTGPATRLPRWGRPRAPDPHGRRVRTTRADRASL